VVVPELITAVVVSAVMPVLGKVREGLLAGAAIGYLCNHNATLSGAEGGTSAVAACTNASWSACARRCARRAPDSRETCVTASTISRRR
jgi:L-serine dehydratase